MKHSEAIYPLQEMNPTGEQHFVDPLGRRAHTAQPSIEFSTQALQFVRGSSGLPMPCGRGVPQVMPSKILNPGPSASERHLAPCHALHREMRLRSSRSAGRITPRPKAAFTAAGMHVSRFPRPSRTGMNRYGEKAAQRPISVETVSFEQYRPEWNLGLVATRSVHWVVESDRHVWQVASRGANPNSPAASRPWTCVNNCTANPTGENAGGILDRVTRGNLRMSESLE